MLIRRGVGRFGASFSGAFGGISAIGAKELRGRMRGRRAFVVLTVYLTVLAGFAWMLESLQASAFQTSGFGGATYQSAQIGTGIFAGLLILETLLVLFLAPAFTAGAISQEREKQTLDLLVTTPISSLSIVLGKLLSALAWVFLLVVASIPLTAIVFVFGGVGPEDLVRGYLVLLVEAVGLGCVGLFFSALLKRTLAATIATYALVLAMTVGAGFVYVFMSATGSSSTVVLADGSTVERRNLAPEGILWFNPFVADMDVLCPTGTGTGGTCLIISAIMGTDSSIGTRLLTTDSAIPPNFTTLPDGTIVAAAGVNVGGGAVAVPQPIGGGAGFLAQSGPVRDAYWPRSAAAWIVLSVVLVLLSVNLVSPTRRWRPRLRRAGPGRPDARSGTHATNAVAGAGVATAADPVDPVALAAPTDPGTGGGSPISGSPDAPQVATEPIAPEVDP